MCLLFWCQDFYIYSLNRAFRSPHVVSSSLFRYVSNSGYHFEFFIVSCVIEIALFLKTFQDFQFLNYEREILVWPVCTFPSWGVYMWGVVVLFVHSLNSQYDAKYSFLRIVLGWAVSNCPDCTIFVYENHRSRRCFWKAPLKYRSVIKLTPIVFFHFGMIFYNTCDIQKR